jgi:hypothetical protein
MLVIASNSILSEVDKRIALGKREGASIDKVWAAVWQVVLPEWITNEFFLNTVNIK